MSTNSGKGSYPQCFTLPSSCSLWPLDPLLRSDNSHPVYTHICTAVLRGRVLLSQRSDCDLIKMMMIFIISLIRPATYDPSLSAANVGRHFDIILSAVIPCTHVLMQPAGQCFAPLPDKYLTRLNTKQK